MSECGSSCPTFSIIGDSYTIYLYQPDWGGVDYNLGKELQSFNFWSGNFNVHDNGINNEPITLVGIEAVHPRCPYGAFCLPPCIPFCMSEIFTEKFMHLREMAKNNEEVTIIGLGDCVDAVYVIKSFSTKTMRAPAARSWILTLEYVRDI